MRENRGDGGSVPRREATTRDSSQLQAPVPLGYHTVGSILRLSLGGSGTSGSNLIATHCPVATFSFRENILFHPEIGPRTTRCERMQTAHMFHGSVRNTQSEQASA